MYPEPQDVATGPWTGAHQGLGSGAGGPSAWAANPHSMRTGVKGKPRP